MQMSSKWNWKWCKSTSFPSLMEWWVICLHWLQMNPSFFSKLKQLNSRWISLLQSASSTVKKSTHLKYFTQVTLIWDLLICFHQTKNIFPPDLLSRWCHCDEIMFYWIYLVFCIVWHLMHLDFVFRILALQVCSLHTVWLRMYLNPYSFFHQTEKKKKKV